MNEKMRRNSNPQKNTGLFYGSRLMGMEYYEEKLRKTLEEWTRFVKGQTVVDDSVVPRDILDSWDRCRRLGVDPFPAPSHRVLSGQALAVRLDANKIFIETSRPFMRHLYRFLEGTGFLVGLFDRDGYILEIIGRHDAENLIRKADVVVGALWDERGSGTNAIGMVMALKKPYQVFGCQHYNRHYHKETASSAPIFDPQGAFIGGISLSGRYYRANPHTLGMTVAAAHAIENQLGIREALRESQLANAYQQTVIGSIPEAIIAIDTQDRITLMNDNAKSLFRLSKKPLLGEPIAKWCGMDNHRFLELIACNEPITHAEVRIVARGNANDCTLTCNPILSPRGERIGKIVIMNEVKRLKGLVTKMMDAKAKLTFHDIQGHNGQFLRTVEQARMAAHSRSNVLLLGKSGTGKDLFAQAIHNEGARRNGPYVAINCGAIPRDLITSELFGYSEGAFTGSRRGGSRGKFELADGGTIFLDEIAETPLELQTALLRVIEEKTVTRIGGTRVRPVDVRIVAATNKNLLREVHKGSFREDLYYRLNVFAIHMVPLRERLDDIPLLVDVFVDKYGKAMGKFIDGVDERVLSLMMLYDWPGNVRELQNVIERMMNVVVGRNITVDLLPSEIAHPGSSSAVDTLPPPIIENERDLIARMLSLKVRKNRIAQTLGMSRSSLYRKMANYGLETAMRKA